MRLNHIVYILLLSGIILAGITSCKKDTVSTDPALQLSFSTDSIVFDTVFTTVGSITKQLKVYNRNKSRLNISSIRLKGLAGDQYSINIDGQAVTQARDIEILPDDSMYVFIKVLINPNDINSPYVVHDQLEFITNQNTQNVELVAWGQNAYYIIANRNVPGLPPFRIVASEYADTTWDNQKPYLVYGYAVVDSNATLRIQEGASIHFHNNSGLWVYKGGCLKVNGTLDNPVTFQGDRLEAGYKDLPGQWDRIWINEGSVNNEINYAIIKNGFIGIQAETLQEQMGNLLSIKNTQIYNMSGMGIFSRFYNISAENTVIANCGTYTGAFTMGGYLDFRHCTFANYYSYSVRQDPSLALNNYFVDTNNVQQPIELQASFLNTIIYGRNDEELLFDEADEGIFNVFFQNNLLKTQMDITTDRFQNCFKNQDPLFVDYEINDYRLDTLSPARDTGDINIALTVPLDIQGFDRTASPDLGAYEFIEE